MSTAIAIPFLNQPVPQEFLTGEPIESLAEGIGSSYAVIGYKGKVWSLRYRGERHTFTRPDDGSPMNSIDVIILRQAKHKSKSFYPEGFLDGQSEGKRPTCASLDGVLPDSDVESPQSNACAICKRNEWKTSPEGKKSRECSDYKRLAVLVLPSITARMFGKPLMEPCFLRVPPASLNDLVIFGETMAGQGYPFHSFVTRIAFNPDKPHPEMQFRPLQALKPAEAPVIMPLLKDPVSIRIVGEDVAPRTAAPAVTQTKQAVLEAAKTMGPPPTAALDTGLGLAAPATGAPATVVTPAPVPPPAAAAPAVAPSQAVIPPASPPAAAAPASTTKSPSNGAGTVDTGFGMLSGAGTETVTVGATPASNSDADVGESTDSDSVLDAKIAALLKT